MGLPLLLCPNRGPILLETIGYVNTLGAVPKSAGRETPTSAEVSENVPRPTTVFFSLTPLVTCTVPAPLDANGPMMDQLRM